MKTLIITIFACLPSLIGCHGPTVDTCAATPQLNIASPGMLVIGDSISMGYTPYLSIPSLEITHTPCNAESSSNGLLYIDKWLAYRQHWSVIIINHGYWDIPPNAQAATPSDYAHNLRIEVLKALEVSDRVLFVNTTAVIPAWTGFTEATVDEYNQAAEAVMTELNVPMIDLNTVSLGIPERDPTILHFTQPGYEILAQAISQVIN